MRHQILHDLGACGAAIEWAETFDTPQAAWDACDRGDWMLWLVDRVSGRVDSPSRRKLVLVSTECARLAWPYVHEQDCAVVQQWYEICERYGRGDPAVKLDDVRRAAWAAAGEAARAAVLKQCASIVRTSYPTVLEVAK